MRGCYLSGPAHPVKSSPILTPATSRPDARGWSADSGSIDHPLRRMPDDMRTGREEVQDALTRYRTLERYELPLAQGGFPSTRCALVELLPVTGRRHQLRRHLKHVAHPIIGDATHGKGPLNRALAELVGLQRLWLHAGRLELRHPVTEQDIVIEAEPGEEWQRWQPFISSHECPDSPLL